MIVAVIFPVECFVVKLASLLIVKSFSRQGNLSRRYLLSTLTVIQNFMLNLLGLFAIYRINLHLALQGSSCLLVVIFLLGICRLSGNSL